jgi:hypothetical protein
VDLSGTGINGLVAAPVTQKKAANGWHEPRIKSPCRKRGAGKTRISPRIFDNRREPRDEAMQPAYFFAVVSLAMASLWAPSAVERTAPTVTVMQNADGGDASDAEQDGSSLMGSIPSVLYRMSGEPLSCELIRLMDEVELITDDSYCG